MKNRNEQKYSVRILYKDNGEKIEVPVIYNSDKYTEEYVREMQEDFMRDSKEIKKKYFSSNIQIERVQQRTFFDLVKIFICRLKQKCKIKTAYAKNHI